MSEASTPAAWQHILEAEYGSHVDASLVSALVHEPGQTLEGARSVLAQLTGHEADVVERKNGSRQGAMEQAASSRKSVELEDDDDDDDDDTDQHNSESDSYEASSNTKSVGTDDIERALAEWKLVDAELQDPATLRMTDEEDHEVQEDRDMTRAVGGTGTKVDAAIADAEVRESRKIGKQAAANHLSVESIAAGEKDEAPPALDGRTATGVEFMSHAFPSRTKQFLQEVLDEEHGDVQHAIDTLMALELAESGALDADDEGDSSQARHDGLENDQLLYTGSGRKKMTKRDRQRRRAHDAQSQALDGKVPIAGHGSNKVNLTDMRHGGGYRRMPFKGLDREEKKSVVSTASKPSVEEDAALAAKIAREERLAAGLPPEEVPVDDAVRDNDWLFSSSVLEQLSILLAVPSHAVRSIHAQCHMNLRATTQRLIHQQAQLQPSLEDMDARQGQAEGTLALTAQGLLALVPSKSRADVERVLRATDGRQDDALDLLQLRDRVEEAAAGEKTDVLDPMKTNRRMEATVDAPGSSFAAYTGTKGHSLIEATRSSASPSPYAAAASHRNRPVGYTAVSTTPSSRSVALQRLREGTPSVTFPLHSAQADEASSMGGDAIAYGAHAETAAQAARMAREYATIAEEYRLRRQENLVKAAQAYRSTAQGVAGGGGGGKTRGHIRGAAAFAYADEARRLDAKARAFSLQAAQAMVRHRTLVARGGVVRAQVNGGMPSMTMSSTSSGRSAAAASARDMDTSGRPGDIVDLHGVTVHEALTITRQALDEWWPRAIRTGGSSTMRDARSTPPLHIITGIGRHSRGHVALIRPAVLAMLEREQWRLREPQQGHIVVLGQR